MKHETIDVRRAAMQRHQEALQAVDSWLALWLAADQKMQDVADRLLPCSSGVALGRMAGYEPKLLVYVDGLTQEAAVYRAVDELTTAASQAVWNEDLDGNPVIQLDMLKCGADWGNVRVWLVMIKAEV